MLKTVTLYLFVTITGVSSGYTSLDECNVYRDAYVSRYQAITGNPPSAHSVTECRPYTEVVKRTFFHDWFAE